MVTPIDSFHGEHAFLSNFHPSPLEVDGVAYPTIEHAFQAAKAVCREDKLAIAACATPGAAKRMGKKIRLRPDWEEVKQEIMAELLRMKFRDPELRLALLATGDRPLIEGNTWGDTYWGVCRGKGQNHLGMLLMKARAELRDSGESREPRS